MNVLIVALLLVVIALLVRINGKLPKRQYDYVEEEVRKALQRDAERKKSE